MGGRGRESGVGMRQLTIEDAERQQAVSDIIREKTQRRAIIDGSSGGNGGIGGSPTLMKKCACCGEYTIPVNSRYMVCPVCEWIDDPHQNANPDSLNGKNPISLFEARARFMKMNRDSR